MKKVLNKDFVETLDPDDSLVIETIHNDEDFEFEGELLDIEKVVRISGEVSGELYLNRGQLQRLIRTLDRVSKRLTKAAS